MALDIINDYAKMKAEKLIELKKYGQQYAAVVKQYDPSTGNEIAPTFAVFTREQLKEEQTKMQTRADSLATILAEMDALG